MTRLAEEAEAELVESSARRVVTPASVIRLSVLKLTELEDAVKLAVCS